MQYLDLYTSFFLFFIIGALVNSLIRMFMDWRVDKQKQQDARLERIEQTLLEMRYGEIDRG